MKITWQKFDAGTQTGKSSPKRYAFRLHKLTNIRGALLEVAKVAGSHEMIQCYQGQIEWEEVGEFVNLTTAKNAAANFLKEGVA